LPCDLLTRLRCRSRSAEDRSVAGRWSRNPRCFFSGRLRRIFFSSTAEGTASLGVHASGMLVPSCHLLLHSRRSTQRLLSVFHRGEQKHLAWMTVALLSSCLGHPALALRRSAVLDRSRTRIETVLRSGMTLLVLSRPAAHPKKSREGWRYRGRSRHCHVSALPERAMRHALPGAMIKQVSLFRRASASSWRPVAVSLGGWRGTARGNWCSRGPCDAVVGSSFLLAFLRAGRSYAFPSRSAG